MNGNASFLPFRAYKGSDPFVFISYAHTDKEAVYADLAALDQERYRIWYDEGIEWTQNFADEIAKAIKRCSFFIAFVSPRAIHSEYVHNEVWMGLKEQKQFLSIFLEDTDLPGAWELELGPKQAAMRFQLDRQQYLRKLKETLPTSLVGGPLEPPPPPPPEEVLTRYIENAIAQGEDCSKEPFVRLGGLLGLNPEDVDRIITATFDRLSVVMSSAADLEAFRQLARFLVDRGALEETSRQTLAYRAKALHIPPKTWERIVQEEALAKARDLAAQEQIAEAEDLLVSSVGKVLSQSAQAREFLEHLQGKKVSVSAPGGESRVQGAPMAAEAPTRPAVAPAAENRAVTPIPGATDIVWVRIPAGLFVRGCPPKFIEHIKAEYGDINTDVLLTYPERKEPLDEFWISLAPVTNVQFYAFVKAMGYRYAAGWRGTMPPYPVSDADKPVTGITWQDSASFAEWLGVRLPTRAEYEKACRGERGLLYPWGNQFDPSKCNTAESHKGAEPDCDKLLPVGSIPAGASPYGVLDLVGNVWQWAADGERQLKMTVGASYEATGEIFGVGFFDVSRPPESSDKDLGFRLASSDLAGVRAPTG
ncbi:MAG: SUMF1/EgtB/PvdO family nonheme iron enzyme [Planctomycetota bacterium]|nr:SUMF1/EgtB/PvdO family nonheme iron enzyme [Planctomycetota bacterium]